MWTAANVSFVFGYAILYLQSEWLSFIIKPRRLVMFDTWKWFTENRAVLLQKNEQEYGFEIWKMEKERE